MRLIPDERELALHRFLAELRGNLGSARSIDKTLRAAVRASAAFFAADGACVTVFRPGDEPPELRFAFSAHDGWDPALLQAVRDHNDARIPNGVLFAQLHRRGRVWGALCLRRDAVVPSCPGRR